MAPQIEESELLDAWRALAGQGQGEPEGWLTIALASGGGRCRAGIRFPANEEALLVEFQLTAPVARTELPQGRGFAVSRVDADNRDRSASRYALSRQQTGNLDLFTTVVRDIVSTLASASGMADERLFQLFLTRIRAWQSFMQRGTDGLLSAEEESGLFGELLVLKELLGASLPAVPLIEAWQGPMNGLQDFVLEPGAIEVKSTLAASGFPARIGSLEQLDDLTRRPLFLAGVRLCLQVTGQTLPDAVTELRGILHGNSVAAALFESRLLHAGYLDAAAAGYTRQFSHVDTRAFAVDEHFPRLARSVVAPEIRSADYEIDLDLVKIPPVGLRDALVAIGVVTP